MDQFYWKMEKHGRGHRVRRDWSRNSDGNLVDLFSNAGAFIARQTPITLNIQNQPYRTVSACGLNWLSSESIVKPDIVAQ